MGYNVLQDFVIGKERSRDKSGLQAPLEKFFTGEGRELQQNWMKYQQKNS